jgi:hypothetical protein
MAAEDRLTGKMATIYLDLYSASEGAGERVRVLDAFDWELTTEVRTEDATIKGESSTRHKVINSTSTWRADRYVQAPAAFSREVIQYLQNPTGANLAAMGTLAGVDSGADGTGTLFGGGAVATAFGAGTAANVRPAVHFALYLVDDKVDSGIADPIADVAPLANSSRYSGQGFLVRGIIGAPRNDAINDRLEVLVDGPLTYAES